MKPVIEVDCAWCFEELQRTLEWPSHRDEAGQPLTNRNHQGGRWISAETADRISADGP